MAREDPGTGCRQFVDRPGHLQCAQLHGVNPEAYLTTVLTKLVNNWPNGRLAELLPWGWAGAL